MSKGNNQKPANGSDLDLEAQLWAAPTRCAGIGAVCDINGFK